MSRDDLVTVVLSEQDWSPCYEDADRVAGVLHPGDVEVIVSKATLNHWHYVMAEFDIVQREMEDAYNSVPRFT